MITTLVVCYVDRYLLILTLITLRVRASPPEIHASISPNQDMLDGTPISFLSATAQMGS